MNEAKQCRRSHFITLDCSSSLSHDPSGLETPNSVILSLLEIPNFMTLIVNLSPEPGWISRLWNLEFSYRLSRLVKRKEFSTSRDIAWKRLERWINKSQSLVNKFYLLFSFGLSRKESLSEEWNEKAEKWRYWTWFTKGREPSRRSIRSNPHVLKKLDLL